ncbi:hypothetical protein [Marinifilum flexuosum]|uniref:hypothetical protein n=1 Tax=Marinifilum flexuosum TaxID=1117708 RepID=UPI0024957F56|nr:hypothetical protein [Marinifilum flexuosum]
MKHREIYKEYKEGFITLDEAWIKLKELPKPWTSKEWKNKRKEILKDSCQKCGETNNLIIQHPPISNKFQIARSLAYETFLNRAKQRIKATDKEIDKRLKVLSKEVAFCKECNRIMQLTDKWTAYRCHKCKIKFSKEDIETELAVLTDSGYQRSNSPDLRSKISEKIIFEKISRYLEKNKNKINELAFKISCDMYEEYLSLKNVQTLCKKCAFIEDKNAGLIGK